MGKADKERLIIAFHYDGTLTDGSNGLDGPYRLRQDTSELLIFLHSKGVSMILWTCRDNKHLDMALEFLRKEGVFRRRIFIFVLFSSCFGDILFFTLCIWILMYFS